MDIRQLPTQALPLNKLVPNTGQIADVPKNPRLIRDERFKQLCKSLQEDDLTGVEPCKVVPFGDKYIVLGGNMRYRALKEIGAKDVSCIVVPEGTPAKVLRKIVQIDNSQFGEYDWDLIANDWDEVELADWGLELPNDWGEGEESEQSVQEDDFDEERDKVETVCKKGEIWLLGKHRLMCGDSTDPEQVKRLLGKETPDLIYTDPPYGMNAVSNSGVLKEKYKTDIHGDNDNSIAIKAFSLCQTLFPNARQVWWGANYYTECLPSSECWLVWDKNNGMSDQTDCELAWANFQSVVRQFTMVSEKQNRIHPTQKPCKLFADIVARMKKQETYTKVLDLFGGSGSTMIACEQMGIQSFIMEYDPHFCTEIIARWEQLTGQKAVKL